MPQPLHPEWDGFDRLLELDEDDEVIPGVPAKARCKKCLHTFSKTEQLFMKRHKENCGKPKQKPKSKRKTKQNKQQRKQTSVQSELSQISDSNGSSFDENSHDGQLNVASQVSEIGSSNSSTRSSTPIQSTSNNDEEESVQSVRRFRPERQRSISTSILDEEDMPREESVLSRSSSIPLVAQPKTAKKVITKRKRRDLNNNDDDDDESPSAEDKELALYKYVLCQDLNFSIVETKPLKILLQTFDNQFEVPSAHELKNVVGLRAADEVCFQNKNKMHNVVLQVIYQIIHGRVETIESVNAGDAEQNEDEDERVQNATVYHHPDTVLVLALLGSEKREWTYIKHCKFEREHETDFSNAIDEFCDASVLACRMEYRINVNFVLHDGQCNLGVAKDITCEDGTVFTYYRISEILPFLSKLQCSLVCDATNHRDVTNFYDCIQNNIPEAVVANNLSMSEAVHRMFQVIGRLDEYNQGIVCNKLLQIISPLHLACKVFHPAYHTDVLNEKIFTPLNQLFCDFQVSDGPELIANIVPYYLQKTAGCFKVLYSKKRESNPIHFWQVTKLDKDLENIELLAEYALNLIQIPAQLKQVDLIKMFERRSHHTTAMSDFDKVFFT